MHLEVKILLLFALAGLCALGLPWFAWRRVRSLEKKYGRILLVRGVSGAQAARLDHMALPYSKTWLRLLFS